MIREKDFVGKKERGELRDKFKEGTIQEESNELVPEDRGIQGKTLEGHKPRIRNGVSTRGVSKDLVTVPQ